MHEVEVLSYVGTGFALNVINSSIFYSDFSLQLQLKKITFFRVLPANFYKGNAMNHYLKLIPLSAVLALATAGVSAQSTAPSTTMPPATTTTPPATLGTTPQEAAAANQQAVPRSDTGTVVRTAPSATDRAQATMNGNTSSDGTMTGTRRARADRN